MSWHTLRYAESVYYSFSLIDIAAAILGALQAIVFIYILCRKKRKMEAADVAMDVTVEGVDGVVSAQHQVWTIHSHDTEDTGESSQLV